MMAKIMDVNDVEAFQMTLDDIIRLQDQRSRQNQNEANLPNVSGEVRTNRAVYVPNATLDELLEARLNNTSRNGGNVGNVGNVGNGGSVPRNGGSLIFNGGDLENGVRGGGGVSTNESVFDEYANEPYGYPLSRGRGGASIIERQHGLRQNNYAGRRNHHNFRHNNNFKPYQNSLCKRNCCSNRCRAQVRLYNLEAQLRAKRGLNMTNGFTRFNNYPPSDVFRHHSRRFGAFAFNRGSRSPSVMDDTCSYKSNHSCCPCDSNGGQFQHRSRSRSRGPPKDNRYRSQSRGRSRSRARSRSRNRSMSRNSSMSRSRGRSESPNRFGNVVILRRKDQVYNLELQEEMSAVDHHNANRTPMIPYPHDPEKWEPEIDHTFITLSMRFDGYYE